MVPSSETTQTTALTTQPAAEQAAQTVGTSNPDDFTVAVADTSVDLDADDDPATVADTPVDPEPEPSDISINLGNVPPGSNVQISIQTPDWEPLYDPESRRSDQDREPESSVAEGLEAESRFRQFYSGWKSVPTTVKAGFAALPIELAANVMPGFIGTIAGVVGPLLMIPGAVVDFRNWRRGDRRAN